MDLTELGKTVANIGLRALGTAIGGPAGAGVADMVSRTLGLDTSEPQRIVETIKTDPSAALKLKELELAHQLELEKLNLETERIRLADVVSARQRETDTVKTTGKRDLNLYLLAWIIVAGFFGLIAALMIVPTALSKEQGQVLLPTITMLFGALAAGFGQVLQYFFGSSKSSQDKTAILAREL